MKRFTIGETDISDASRPIKESEINAAQENGIDYFELKVAIDGIAVIVNQENGFVDYLTIEELKKNAPNLRELNEWYRNNSTNLGVDTTSFYETRRIFGFFVVDESSADPGIPGAASIALDEDHTSIAKPEDRSALQHIRLKKFIEK